MKRTIALTWIISSLFGHAFSRPQWYDHRTGLSAFGAELTGYIETPIEEYYVCWKPIPPLQ